jgi:hypothetical protein
MNFREKFGIFGGRLGKHLGVFIQDIKKSGQHLFFAKIKQKSKLFVIFI